MGPEHHWYIYTDEAGEIVGHGPDWISQPGWHREVFKDRNQFEAALSARERPPAPASCRDYVKSVYSGEPFIYAIKTIEAQRYLREKKYQHNIDPEDYLMLFEEAERKGIEPEELAQRVMARFQRSCERDCDRQTTKSDAKADLIERGILVAECADLEK